MAAAIPDQYPEHGPMLTRIYIEALLVDQDSADLIWTLWHEGRLTDDMAAWLWTLVSAEIVRCRPDPEWLTGN